MIWPKPLLARCRPRVDGDGCAPVFAVAARPGSLQPSGSSSLNRVSVFSSSKTQPLPNRGSQISPLYSVSVDLYWKQISPMSAPLFVLYTDRK